MAKDGAVKVVYSTTRFPGAGMKFLGRVLTRQISRSGPNRPSPPVYEIGCSNYKVESTSISLNSSNGYAAFPVKRTVPVSHELSTLPAAHDPPALRNEASLFLG